MKKHNVRDAVYGGYLVPMDHFITFLKQMPSLKELKDETEYRDEDIVLCYSHWKHHVVPQNMRKNFPKIETYWAPPVPQDLEHEPTHIMFLTTCLPFPTVEAITDKDKLLETEKDRRFLRAYIKFFQSLGAQDISEEMFEWGHLVSFEPDALTVRPPSPRFCEQY
ncbi:hypothetical protein NMY22_g14262 [Coprinellus aureogranulatus]|nr:hypothetical protein NMY22_g14262 [Coprinellus aureogranulatus]